MCYGVFYSVLVQLLFKHSMLHDQGPRARTTIRLGANQGSTLHGMLYVARAPAPLLTKIYNQWVPRVAGDILSCLDHHSAGSRLSIHHQHSLANHLSLLDLHLDRHWPPQHSTRHRHETIWHRSALLSRISPVRYHLLSELCSRLFDSNAARCLKLTAVLSFGL